jgi:S-formylglutathione hydrolase FrmB
MRQGRGTAAIVSIVMLLGMVAASAHANSARIVAQQRVKPRVVELTIATPAFAAPTKVDVDLPTGYDSDPDRRWPVTYFLAGTMNTYRSFNSVVDGVKLTEAYPSILVSPNGDSGYWSDWYNGGAFGPPMYETYVIDQLIPLIDAHFRTVRRRSQRAVMGVSMGGYGAMMVAARHPDLFGAAASLSGAVDSNLAANGAVLSASPEFQGAQADAIYGPRATQEVRWRGHNPTDLADNLRSLDLQVRSADGIPNPGIGEQPASADTPSCIVEGGVYMASVDLHDALDGLHIPHLWDDYGPGCHTPANFSREIVDTLAVFTKDFAHPPATPGTFAFRSVKPAFDVWGWHVSADPRRALEFLRLDEVSAHGLTLIGSGLTTVTSPPLFRGLRRVGLSGAAPAVAAPDAAGRIRFTVDLGPADTDQQYTQGARTAQVSRTVSFEPVAVIRIARVRAARGGVRFCARALGGPVAARARVASGRAVSMRLTARATCRLLRGARSGILVVSGRDRFGHRVSRRRAIRRG